MLLKDWRIDPSADGNWACVLASIHGNLVLLELLMEDPRVDANGHDNMALSYATNNGHSKLVRVLMNGK